MISCNQANVTTAIRSNLGSLNVHDGDDDLKEDEDDDGFHKQ
jgi:hypothetical protein